MQNNKPHHEVGVYDLFIAALAIAAVVLITVRLALPEDSMTGVLIDYMDYGICVVFFYDFLRSLLTAENKWRYFYTWGWFDLLASIPAVSSFRYFRLARIFRIIRVLRSIRILVQVTRRDRAAALLALLFFVGIIAFIGICIGVLNVEARVPNARLQSPEDVLWWAIVTCSTVGYGDEYPVTNAGRLLASMLMVIGIGAFATTTSALSIVFRRWQRTRGDRASEMLNAKVDSIDERLEKIEGLLLALQSQK